MLRIEVMITGKGRASSRGVFVILVAELSEEVRHGLVPLIDAIDRDPVLGAPINVLSCRREVLLLVAVILNSMNEEGIPTFPSRADHHSEAGIDPSPGPPLLGPHGGLTQPFNTTPILRPRLGPSAQFLLVWMYRT